MKKSTFLILIGIFILAFILRSYSAITYGVWLDEASVYTIASSYDTQHLSLMKHWDVAHPPLFYLLIHWLITLNNHQFIPIISLRIPFVIFSSLAVFSIYFLTRKIFRSSFIALISCFWYAIHPFQILLGYSMRPYGLLQFLIPIACFSFYEKYWKNYKHIIFWNILFIFLFYWDYAFIWFILIFFIDIGIKLFRRSITLKYKFIRTSPFILSILLWLPIFLSRLNDLFYLTKYSQIFSLNNAILLLSGFNLIDAYQTKNNIFSIAVVIMCLVICTFYFLKRGKNIYVINGIYIPVLFAYIFSYFVKPIFIPQNYIFSSLLLITIFTSPFLYVDKKKSIGLFIIITIFLSKQVSIFPPHYEPIKYFPQLQSINDEGVITFYYLGKELDYSIRYQLLNLGFKPMLNSTDNFERGKQKISLNTFNLKRPEAYGLINNSDITNLSNRYFLVESNTYFNPEQKQLILKYCYLTDSDFQKLQIKNEAIYLPCRNQSKI